MDPAASRPPLDSEKLLTALETAREAVQAPAAVIGVQRGEDAPLLLASGIADLASGRLAETGDTFSVGSVTKPFVATAALQLCAEAAISLDAHPADFGIQFPHSTEISLRQLLNHSSGVFNFGNDVYGKPLPLLRAFAQYRWSFGDVLEIIASHSPDFPPGNSVKYSNSNYIILGRILELASGEPLGALLRSRIFDPLGLQTIRYAADEPGDWPSLRGYLQPEWGGADVTELETHQLFGPGGGIISTAADLLRGLAAMENGELLSGEWQSLLLDDVLWDEAGSSGLSCGMQHFRRSWAGFRGHGGNTHGYTAGLWSFPADGLRLVFGLNRAYVRERAFLQPLLDHLRS